MAGRHEFRVARVVAETADATQIHDADGEPRAARRARRQAPHRLRRAQGAAGVAGERLVDEALDGPSPGVSPTCRRSSAPRPRRVGRRAGATPPPGLASQEKKKPPPAAFHK